MMDSSETLVAAEIAVFCVILGHFAWKQLTASQRGQQTHGKKSTTAPKPAASSRSNDDLVEEVIKRLKESAKTPQKEADLTELSIPAIPALPELQRVERLAVRLRSGNTPIPGLEQCGGSIKQLRVVGPALSKATLETIFSLPSLQQLDLRDCRTVVESDNSVAVSCAAVRLAGAICGASLATEQGALLMCRRACICRDTARLLTCWSSSAGAASTPCCCRHMRPLLLARQVLLLALRGWWN